MRYALIGCGRIATNHIKAALENSVEIVALCDIHLEAIHTLADKHGLTGRDIPEYEDYREMLRREQPELVAIATESGSHAAIALDCLSAGCHVIIEKPIALSIADAKAIIARGKKRGRLVCASHQNRFNQSIGHVRRAIEAGRFGRLSHGTIHVRWNRDKSYYEQAPWRGTWAQDGGALMNQSIHGIDMLRWMMGDEIDEVFAYTARQQHSYLECEDVGLAVVKFKSGALGTIEGTTNVFPANLEETLYLFGENGTVKAGGKSLNRLDVWRFADEQPEDVVLAEGFEEKTENVYGNGHPALYADMLGAIRNHRQPYVDGEAGLRALELVLSIYQSAATGRPVKLPLAECASMDFAGLYD